MLRFYMARDRNGYEEVAVGRTPDEALAHAATLLEDEILGCDCTEQTEDEHRADLAEALASLDVLGIDAPDEVAAVRMLQAIRCGDTLAQALGVWRLAFAPSERDEIGALVAQEAAHYAEAAALRAERDEQHRRAQDEAVRLDEQRAPMTHAEAASTFAEVIASGVQRGTLDADLTLGAIVAALEALTAEPVAAVQ